MNGDKRPLDWKSAAIAVLIATAANGTIPYVAPSWGRPEPFKASEAQRLREEMREQILREVKLLLAEAAHGVPPGPMRQRVRSVEAWIMLRDPAYRPPTEAWRD